MRNFAFLMLIFIVNAVNAESARISGSVTFGRSVIEFAIIGLKGMSYSAITDKNGKYNIENVKPGSYLLTCSFLGFETFNQTVTLLNGEHLIVNIQLKEHSNNLNEIVISESSKATLLKENPIPILPISQAKIEQSSASNIIDILANNAPGLNVLKTGPNISKPFIRGLGYNRVLTLYDGMRQEGQQWGDEHGLEVDYYNIANAAVVKGPASLMYGSDALAGVISLSSFIPDKQDGKLHGRFTTEYQSNNNLVGSGLNTEYSDSRFLLSLNGSYRAAQNYRNSIDDRVYLSNFSEKNFSFRFGHHSSKGYTRFSFTLYDNKQGIPDGSRDSLSRKFTKQIFDNNEDDLKNRPLVSSEELQSYKIPILSQHFQHYRVFVQSFYKVEKGSIDVVLGFQQNVRKEFTHIKYVDLPGMLVQLNTVNYGIKYNLPKFYNFEISVGANGMLQFNKNKKATDFPIPNYALYEGGFFAFGKWKYKRWSISGGIRYDLRNVQWKDFYVSTNPHTGFMQQAFFPDTANSTLQYAANKKMFHGISASLGLSFKAAKGITLKANIGRAYRAPNITEMASNGLDPGAHIIYLGNRNFNPEFSLQEDLGILGNFTDVSFELNAFNNNIQNYIYLSLVTDAQGNAIVDAQGNRTYQYKQSKAQLYGGEFWLAIHPEKLSGFNLESSLSLIYGMNRNKQYKGKKINGEYLPLIPPLKFTSNISYLVKLSKIKSHTFSILPSFGLEYNASQNRYLGLNNSETFTPAYWLLNLGISASLGLREDRTVQFVFQVNNLLDKAYQSHLSRLKYFEYYQNSPNGKLGIYNMGRSINIKVIISF